ncbi:hypothetical protein B0T16DRAFT_79380 [Cercophora newfieldiana]|uniref:Uncharacterized protein n=1 Tax=Cercophora newfieldiana TaxID=92897 RepID=A0AA40CTY5_9PEZI|nr:hypothetical protein B0T16DRAFT_79380 [Cercophora newfieldiana]
MTVHGALVWLQRDQGGHQHCDCDCDRRLEVWGHAALRCLCRPLKMTPSALLTAPRTLPTTTDIPPRTSALLDSGHRLGWGHAKKNCHKGTGSLSGWKSRMLSCKAGPSTSDPTSSEAFVQLPFRGSSMRRKPQITDTRPSCRPKLEYTNTQPSQSHLQQRKLPKVLPRSITQTNHWASAVDCGVPLKRLRNARIGPAKNTPCWVHSISHLLLNSTSSAVCWLPPSLSGWLTCALLCCTASELHPREGRKRC